MNNAHQLIEKISVDDFILMLDEENPFELIDGEVVYMTPTKFQHSKIAVKLLMALNTHAEKNNLGQAFMETTFVMPDSDDPNWVKGSRIPDLMFINSERLAYYEAHMPDWENKPLILVPDLVVEIVSPTDSYSDIDRKVDGYLRDGVSLVWIIDPRRKKVNVVKTNSQIRLSVDDMLTGNDVIGGFEIPVAAIFE